MGVGGRCDDGSHVIHGGSRRKWRELVEEVVGLGEGDLGGLWRDGVIWRKRGLLENGLVVQRGEMLEEMEGVGQDEDALLGRRFEFGEPLLRDVVESLHPLPFGVVFQEWMTFYFTIVLIDGSASAHHPFRLCHTTVLE